MGKIKRFRSRELIMAVMIISARLVHSMPENMNNTFLAPIDSSHLKMEARDGSDDGASDVPLKTVSEISSNADYSSKVKTDDQANRPFDPIISSRSSQTSNESRNRIPNNGVIISTKDSYLTALKHSHKMKDSREDEWVPSKYPILEYNPGPVYRGDNNESTITSTNTLAPIIANKLESEPKISRISYGGNTYDIPADNYVLPSVEPNYGSSDQVSYGTNAEKVSYGTPLEHVPYGAHYDNYDKYNSYDTYGPPIKNHKLVSQSYGAPSYSSSYGPPHPYGTSQGLGSLQATYSTSHPLPDFFPFTFLPAVDLSWPISLKIDAFTLIKIVLKIIVFKMIVKFIGVICLLIFVPKLIHKKKHKYDEDDDLSRSFTNTSKFPEEQLRLLGSIVNKSIEYYRSMNMNGSKREKPCTDAECQIMNKLFSLDDTWEDYSQVFKAYVAEEQSVQKQSKGNRSRRK